ncbi:hypothetical protein WT72_24315 [Burkholderia pseudomultivorans]|uniref:hypothetical protein n=1 Tax=Burkholderia pseudomultivorans TaxID=1207504 RepID=UPI000757B03A|nr:hypothetical protein [Burkholderia pseudomultivorans]KWI50299.1 hypothetical protein WT72_24315 [Burkholderia pseudomultivorans]
MSHITALSARPDYAGRSREALGAMFDHMVDNLQEQWRADAKERSDTSALKRMPEPMLGEMGTD